MPLILSLLLLPAAVLGNEVLQESKTNGGFAIMGTLCFPAGASETLLIETTTPKNDDATANQRLLYFDDEIGSIDAFGASLKSCDELIKMSKSFTAANNNHGINLPGGFTQTHLTINENRDRQWYFLVSNCNIGEKKELPVKIEKFSITSTTAISCQDLNAASDDHGGYIAAVVILTLLAVALMGFVGFLVYKVYFTSGLGDGLNSGLMYGSEADSGDGSARHGYNDL